MLVVLMAIPLKAMATTNSTISCIDASVLEENITVYISGNATTLSLPVHCPFGCDSITLTCSPDPFMQDLMFAVFVIGCIVVLAWVLKVRL